MAGDPEPRGAPGAVLEAQPDENEDPKGVAPESGQRNQSGEKDGVEAHVQGSDLRLGYSTGAGPVVDQYEGHDQVHAQHVHGLPDEGEGGVKEGAAEADQPE